MVEIIGALAKALGKGQKKVFAGIISVADGDVVNTGLKKLDVVLINPTVASRSFRVQKNTPSDGQFTVGLTDLSGAAITTAEDVEVFAIGDPV